MVIVVNLQTNSVYLDDFHYWYSFVLCSINTSFAQKS